MRHEPGYTVKETAALAGLSERTIRNEIERGVIRVRRKARGRGAAVELPKGAVFYFRLLRDIPVRLPRRDRGELFRLLSGTGERAGAWRVEHGALRRGILVLDTRSVRDDLDRSLRGYEAGRQKAVSDPEILGGEPVFAGTRIAIRHIGRLAARGIPVDEIRADFPALSADDIAFAAVFARMRPGPGRPSRLRFRREAA